LTGAAGVEIVATGGAALPVAAPQAGIGLLGIGLGVNGVKNSFKPLDLRNVDAYTHYQTRDPNTGRFVSDPNNPPSPNSWTDANRRAAWRELVEDPNSPLTPAQKQQVIDRGYRGPQRINPTTGEAETMELSHEPVPRRNGGTNVVPRWPKDHAAVDPNRQLPKTKG
jgi:hypothetical protein